MCHLHPVTEGCQDDVGEVSFDPNVQASVQWMPLVHHVVSDTAIDVVGYSELLIIIAVFKTHGENRTEVFPPMACRVVTLFS
jgi:hypothetical protein